MFNSIKFKLIVNQKLLAIKLETIRQIVAIQLEAFFSVVNAITGPKKNPVINPRIIPTTHSDKLSSKPNKLEIIGVNTASAKDQITLKIMKKSIEYINSKILKYILLINYYLSLAKLIDNTFESFFKI